MMSRVLHADRIAAALCCVALASCGGKSAPAPPSVPNTPSTGDVSVSGGERLGWSQPAANAGELSTFQYAIYVDDNRSVLSAVTCADTPGATGLVFL